MANTCVHAPAKAKIISTLVIAFKIISKATCSSSAFGHLDDPCRSALYFREKKENVCDEARAEC